MTSTSRYYAATDGLRLHLRVHRSVQSAPRTPAVCLCGLTRNSADFEPLARALTTTSATPRTVLAFDYRGRGLSDHDADWRHYDLATERADILKGLELEGIAAAHIIGTSRGGLHAMALADSNRDLIRGVVLNDIGPVLEADGLRRIKGYVGRSSTPRSDEDAIEQLQRITGGTFDGLTADEWLLFARTTFGSDPQDLRLRYDPKLARTLDAFDLSKPLPDLWRQFDLLRGAPVLTIRGANSDLLSTATLAAMGDRWPGCEAFTVPGQGHAPLLADDATVTRIDRFLARADECA